MTSIDDYAFLDCAPLNYIAIPVSVQTIGKWAFEGCNSLIKLYRTESDGYSRYSNHQVWGFERFAQYQGILYALATVKGSPYAAILDADTQETNVSIPQEIEGHPVVFIGDAAFHGNRMESVVIPSSVESIGDSAFSNCPSLASTKIPSSVVFISDGAFAYCHSLESVVIPSSVTSISGSAFYGCSRLSVIHLPSSIKTIGDRAFYGCSRLTSVQLPSSLETIGNFAFFGCSEMTMIVIPSSVISIRSRAFQLCRNLTIYCEVESRPDDWSSTWNSNRPVVWGYKG